jgi:hypothetical protein
MSWLACILARTTWVDTSWDWQANYLMSNQVVAKNLGYANIVVMPALAQKQTHPNTPATFQ